MSTHLKFAFIVSAQAALFFSPVAAGAGDLKNSTTWPISAAVQTATGQQIPAGAIGIALIETPRVAKLLKLRGVMGTGTVTLRSDTSQDCLTLPVRLVAGDFGGDGISIHKTSPIRLIIRSQRAADALAGGDDVVSDMYRISSQVNDPKADIIIQSGLSDSHGFVLNPGSSLVADVFGTTASHTACSAF